ncbi:MAG: maltose ABC transporter substrate-binding protein [Treponema sp.]|nr:maltose ABC transporter substrate-binding protein [Treponema sp.]
MKKIHKIIIGTIFFTTIFSSYAVAKNKDGSISKNDPEIHLRVWESEDEEQYNFIRQAGKEFTKLYPNIHIEYIAHDFHSTVDDVKIDGPNGVGPDLFSAPHDKLGELVKNNLVLPVENDSEVKKQILGACAKALTYNGQMYGYPLSAETYALFYNKALISENEVPESFEELIEWNKNFKKKNPGKQGFVMDFYNGYYTIIFTTLDNNRLFGESGTEVNKTYLTTPAAIRGIKFFQKLNTELALKSVSVNTATCDGLFMSGNAAMHITGLWNIKPFENSGIDFGVTTLPSLPGEKTPAASFSGTRGMFVSAFSRHPKEAALFGQFLISKEIQQLRYKLTGTMPSVDIKTDSKYMDGFIKQLNYAFPMPSIPEMANFWNYGNAVFPEIWNGADVEKTLNKLDYDILH